MVFKTISSALGSKEIKDSKKSAVYSKDKTLLSSIRFFPLPHLKKGFLSLKIKSNQRANFLNFWPFFGEQMKSPLLVAHLLSWACSCFKNCLPFFYFATIFFLICSYLHQTFFWVNWGLIRLSGSSWYLL